MSIPNLLSDFSIPTALNNDYEITVQTINSLDEKDICGYKKQLEINVKFKSPKDELNEWTIYYNGGLNLFVYSKSQVSIHWEYLALRDIPEVIKNKKLVSKMIELNQSLSHPNNLLILTAGNKKTYIRLYKSGSALIVDTHACLMFESPLHQNIHV